MDSLGYLSNLFFLSPAQIVFLVFAVFLAIFVVAKFLFHKDFGSISSLFFEILFFLLVATNVGVAIFLIYLDRVWDRFPRCDNISSFGQIFDCNFSVGLSLVAIFATLLMSGSFIRARHKFHDKRMAMASVVGLVLVLLITILFTVLRVFHD